HFNVCLRPAYLSVGLGFEFTLNKGGDPTAVGLAYSCFLNVIATNQKQFERFVADNHLEIEWAAKKDDRGSLKFVPTYDVVPWLLNRQLDDPSWISIARLLRSGQDTAVLGDPKELGEVMEAVLCGFRPFWEQTQELAYKNKI